MLSNYPELSETISWKTKFNISYTIVLCSLRFVIFIMNVPKCSIDGMPSYETLLTIMFILPLLFSQIKYICLEVFPDLSMVNQIIGFTYFIFYGVHIGLFITANYIFYNKCVDFSAYVIVLLGTILFAADLGKILIDCYL
jgi:hypothetical protein